MATLVVTQAWICEGGGHVHLIVCNGVQQRELTFDRAELARGITEEEVKTTFRVLIRSSLVGLTPAQALTKLNSGFDIVVN